ncbi:MAG: hypothetical protein ACKVJK_00020 [Methylophagaceae bacterium]|jgi:hypothetical protein|tara:strand:+ start:2458 stop:2877 length:420 start_codon:yes stop_codon:yes gene_type:complete
MKLKLRRLEESDYDTLVTWWKDWKWEAPPRDFLPENGTGGFMVSNNDSDICAGFIYLTNSKIAWIEFIISDKQYKEEDRNEAIQFLINSLSGVAEETGAKYGYAILKNKSLMKYYEEANFTVTSDNNTEMITIWQQQQQ